MIELLYRFDKTQKTREKDALMDFHAVVQLLANAAAQLGPAGAATAVLQGGAKAAGGAAFNAIKDWCVNTFGAEAELARSITALEAQPRDPAAQTAVLKALEGNAATLEHPEFIRRVEELRQQVNAPAGMAIGVQNADKIANISGGNINTFTM